MDWSLEAQQMLESIPVFIRKSAARKIEIYAKEKGIRLITSEIMQNVRNQSK